MPAALPPAGLYAIADLDCLAPAALTTAAAQALQGGARLLQLRAKQATPARRLSCAQALQDLCRRHAVPLLINDDVELCRRCGAAGVHLGRDDDAPAAARAVLGPGAIIGVSCYDDLARAQTAAAAGADYVAFGSFFPSRTKPEAVPAQLETLRRARTQLSVPIAAIGGITPANGATLVAAGATWLAVIRGLFAAPDIAGAARAYQALFP